VNTTKSPLELLTVLLVTPEVVVYAEVVRATDLIEAQTTASIFLNSIGRTPSFAPAPIRNVAEAAADPLEEVVVPALESLDCVDPRTEPGNTSSAVTPVTFAKFRVPEKNVPEDFTLLTGKVSEVTLLNRSTPATEIVPLVN
jgi:hypothetical protein